MTDLPQRVLYIVGSGRSGSTVVDILLGNLPSAESVGELCNLAQRAWIDNEVCSCGAAAQECPFWSKVRLEWERLGQFSDLSEYARLQSLFENFKSPRVWIRLARERRSPSPEFLRYAALTRSLFQAIRTIRGKELVIDSSKNPARALALTIMPGIDLFVVHLIRDGRGVGNSLRQAFARDVSSGLQKEIRARPVWRTTLFWVAVNLQSEWVGRHVARQRQTRLRYEDLTTAPGESLAVLGELVGQDVAELRRAVDQGEPLGVGHLVAGNRLRMAGSLRLSLDEKWKTALSKREKQQFWLMAGWLARRYGYAPAK